MARPILFLTVLDVEFGAVRVEEVRAAVLKPVEDDFVYVVVREDAEAEEVDIMGFLEVFDGGVGEDAIVDEIVVLTVVD